MHHLAIAIETAARQWGDAVMHEMELEDARQAIKMAAIGRIMTGENRMTGKPHSFSSAEAMVYSDENYASHLERLRIAAGARTLAQGVYHAAVANANLMQGAHNVV